MLVVQTLLLDLAASGIGIIVDGDELVLSGDLRDVDLGVVRQLKPEFLVALGNPLQTGSAVLDEVIFEVRDAWLRANCIEDGVIAPWLDESLDHGLLDEAAEKLRDGDLMATLQLVARWRREWLSLLRPLGAAMNYPVVTLRNDLTAIGMTGSDRC